MQRCKSEEPAGGEEPAVAAALDFLSKFSGKRFDALVAQEEPHAASATLQQAFAQRLEDLAEAECSGVEVKEEEEEVPPVPPWRVKSIPVAGTGGVSDPRQCLPASAPSAFAYGPGTGRHAVDSDGKTLRFFDNGHLTFSMVFFCSRMRPFFKLVFPSFKLEVLSLWFL